MNVPFLLGKPNSWRTGLILLALLTALISGISGLIYPSTYSPLLAGAIVAAAMMAITWVRKPVWALYAALFVVLLPIGLIPPPIHSNLNRSITVIALGVWLFDVITRRHRVVWTPTALLMVGFLTWAVVTLAWAVHSEAAQTSLQMYTLRLLLFLILMVNQIRTKESLNGLMNTLALNGWLLLLTGLGTVLFLGYTPGTRFQLFEMNENGFGIAALVAMSGVLWRVTRASGRQRAMRLLLSFIFILLALILIVLSGSRGSAISFFITLLAFWFWKPTRPWGKLGLLLVAGALLAAPFLFLTILERFAVERGDTLLGGREAIWQGAWRLIWDQPWRGVGIGNAPYAVMPYLRLFMPVSQFEWVALHNPILTIWAETGIPGLLLYLSVPGSAVWLFVRQYWRHSQAGLPYLRPYYAIMFSIFLGYMASWIKGGGMESDFTYFLMLALLLIPSGLEIENEEVK